MKHTFFKRIIALVLTLAMVLSLMPSVFAAESDLPFQDVEEGKWYYEAVQYVYEHELMNGMSETAFGPNIPLTRGMLVTILYRAEGEPAVTGSHGFEDVTAGKYYADAVSWAVANEITKGISATKFAPGLNVTREQMATFLYRYAAYKGYDTRELAELTFPDAYMTHDWALEAVEWAVARKIINGVGVPGGPDELRPLESSTRAQVAAVLMRFLEGYLHPLAGKTVILHTNDTHGALKGFAQVAKVKADLEAQGATVVLVDAGDYSQGTTYVSTNKGAAAVTMLNAAGYDFVTLGNHEFDFGYAQLMENMTKAEFQPIVADVLLKETGESIFDGHAIKEVNGVKIGFFGMETPETFTKVNPGLIQEITFPQGEEMYACAQAEVDALKEAGADLVIGLVHLGVDAESEPNRSIDLYEHVTGIDFLIDGHSHTVMTEGPNGEPIQSTGTKASKTAFMNVGYIQIDNETKQIEENKLIPLGDDAPVDETVAAVAQEIMDAVDAEYGAKFAESLVELNGDRAPGNRNMETNLGDLITDSMLWGVLKDMDAETLGVPEENVVAITNGGGIRAWIHAGDVTKNDINTVLPFGNTVAVVYVTGAELLEALEASTYCTPTAVGGFPQVAGMKINIDTTKAFDQGEQYPDSTYYGPASIQRVTIDEINGQAFDPAATYAVVTNNFCAAGGDTYYAFKAASAQFDTGLPMDEVLMEYITTELNAVIGEDYAEPQGRITFEERNDTEICFPSTSNDDIAKYGNIYTNITGADFFALGYTWGDVVTVKFLDQELDLPVVPTFSYVDQGTPGVFVNKDGETGEPTGRMFMAINMGDFATTYGLATKTTNADKTYFWTAVEGVEFPVPVTVTMKEAGGYATEMAIRDINRTNNREDYPELTDAEFANFRQITTTGMGDHLYRGSSPINPEIGRNTYADAELENAGVTVIMNLANDQATAEAYPGYADTYYSGQNIIFLNLGVDFQADDFKAGLAVGLRHFASNPGVYYVHCTEGKDRAGFVSALLECFMGATYDEVVADYLKTYTNYYTVVDGVQQPLSQETLDAIANSNIIKTLQTAFGVEDLTTADLAAEAEEYITQIGLTEEEIANLRTNLGGSDQPIKVETTFPSATKADIDKYGDVHFSITSAELAAAGFEYKDLVKLSFLDQEVIVPVIPQYRYVGAKAAGLVMWEDGTKPAEVEVFNGSFAATYGLADVVREGSDYTVTPREGVEFPVPVTIEMYEKQGYADTYAIFDLTRSNDREDYRGNTEPYPNLDDEAFANFRVVDTTGMGEGALYRSSSPINPSIGRNTYADQASEAHGVKSFVNLADSAASAAKYAGYAETYYSDQEILFLNLGVDFTTELNREGLVQAMDFLQDCPTPVLVHCNEGQDRAGFVSALLECLMGASYDEVVDDYMVTFYNYYGVQKGTDQYNQISNNIVKNLSTAFGLEMSQLADADLAAEAEAYFQELGVSEEVIAAVKVNLGKAPETGNKFEILQTSSNSTRFGHLDMNISVADFLELFELGDVVTVEVNGFTFDAPVVTNYDDVDTGEYLLRCANGKQVVTLAINYGQIGVVSGMLEKITDPETGNVSYQFVDGIEWPVYATVELKEAGGYADELAVRQLTRTNNREDYPDLTDAEFANFRAVSTPGMGENTLYRSSSPIDPDLGRNTYADAAAEAAGVKTFINLADTQAEAEAFEGYADTYYSTQTVKFLGLPVAFTSDEFKAGLAEGYRFIVNNNGPYLIHCLEGKDRTGLSVAVLEALMGAELEDIQADYLKTYTNYFDVQNGVHNALTEAQEEVLTGIITKNLGIIFDADMETADLQNEAEAYLTELGLTDEEIETLKANLGGDTQEEPEVSYVLCGWINGAACSDEEDWENPSPYVFDEEGKLTATFTEPSYVWVKLSDNSTGFKTNGYDASLTSVTLYNYNVYSDMDFNKMYVPAGDYEFTLVVNDDDTLTLSYAEAEENTACFQVADTVEEGDRILYVVSYNDKTYAMTSDTSVSNALGVVEVTVEEDGTIAEAADPAIWTLAAGDAEGAFLLQADDGSYITYANGTALALNDTGVDFEVIPGEGAAAIRPQGISNRQIFLRDNNDVLQFRCYSTQNLTASGYCSVMTVYKWVED